MSNVPQYIDEMNETFLPRDKKRLGRNWRTWPKFAPFDGKHSYSTDFEACFPDAQTLSTTGQEAVFSVWCIVLEIPEEIVELCTLAFFLEPLMHFDAGLSIRWACKGGLRNFHISDAFTRVGGERNLRYDDFLTLVNLIHEDGARTLFFG